MSKSEPWINVSGSQQLVNWLAAEQVSPGVYDVSARQVAVGGTGVIHDLENGGDGIVLAHKSLFYIKQ